MTNGKLCVGDIAVAGSEYGKVRAIPDDKGNNLNEATSSMPVQVLGLNNLQRQVIVLLERAYGLGNYVT